MIREPALVIGFLQIPFSEFELTYARSSGPGGQNVNKVNSKAVLRWNIATSPSVTDALRNRVLERLQNHLTRAGEILITSDRFRDQTLNREDCYRKLEQLLESATRIEKHRKKTRPSRSSIRKVKENKNRHSAKKQLRRAPRERD